MTTAIAGIVPVIRWVQVPLLALFLLAGCAGKGVRVMRAGSLSAGLGPTELFPRRLRRPAALAVCAAELGLGASLILTARQAGMAAGSARLATAVFFLVATSALVELRARRPDVGCGCFGDLSTRPVGARSITRAALLAGAALAGLGARPPRLPTPGRAAADLAILAAELLLLSVLSPEITEMLVRLGYSEPCEMRVIPPQRVLASLHRSAAWRRSAHAVAAAEPSDMWRELCWWYVVYPARERDEGGEVVFAVQVKSRRPAVHSARVEAPEAEPEPPPALLPAPLPVA